MRQWNVNVDVSCILYQEPIETVAHLFFGCLYSKHMWRDLARGVLKEHYTESWMEIVRFITDSSRNNLPLFATRYMFQAAVHSIRREKNRRRHGEKESHHLCWQV